MIIKDWFNGTSKIVQIILLAIIAFLVFKSCNKVNYYRKAYLCEHDSLATYINKDGLNESKIKELELTKSDLKHRLDTMKITTKTKTVTQIKTETEFVDVVNTIVIHDTIYVQGKKSISPIYESEVNNFWYTAKVKATKDSTTLDINFVNETIIKREQKRGLFKSKPIDLIVIQQNPNTTNKGVKAYKLKSKAPLFNVSVQSGIGLDLMDSKPTIYVGVGVGLNLIR